MFSLPTNDEHARFVATGAAYQAAHAGQEGRTTIPV